MKFTNSAISRLKTRNSEYEIGDPAEIGLKIRVAISGRKTFYQHYDNSEGRKRKYKIGVFPATTVSRARELAREVKKAVADGNDPLEDLKRKRARIGVPGEMPFQEFLEKEYFKSIAFTDQKSPFRTKQILFSNFDHLMQKPVNRIDKKDMDDFVRNRQDEKNPPKAATINRAVTSLKAVLSWAASEGHIEQSPLKGRKRLFVADKGVVRWLKPDEEKRLLNALEKEEGHLPIIVQIMMNTGARPIEVFTLKWEVVDFENRTIMIDAAYSKSRKTRPIPINKKLLPILKNWRKQSKSVWVFPSGSERGHITTIQKGWNRLLDRAEISNFRLYDLRHNFGSQMAMKGIDIYTIKEIMGHEDIKMTSIYAHLSNDHKRAAVDVL